MSRLTKLDDYLVNAEPMKNDPNKPLNCIVKVAPGLERKNGGTCYISYVHSNGCKGCLSDTYATWKKVIACLDLTH